MDAGLAATHMPTDFLAESSADAYAVRLALTFAPAARRRDIELVQTLADQWELIVARTGEAAVAQLKLEWWRQEIERTYRRQPTHPLTRALAPTLAERALPPAPFLDMLDSLAALVRDGVGLRSLAALEQYAARLGGQTMQLIARLGDDAPALDTPAGAIGTAIHLARLLRRAQGDAGGWLRYLPETNTTTGERQRDHAEHVLALLDRTRAQIPAAQRHKLVYALILAALERARLDVMHRRPATLSAPRQLWIAWRTAMAIRRGR